MRNLQFLFFLIFSAGFFVPPVSAGVVMVTVNSKIKAEDTIIAKTYIAKDRMRVEMSGEKLDITSIFHLDEKIFWMIDNKDNSYKEMTEKDLQEIKEKMEIFEERMKKIPPEMRKIIEGVMKGMVPIMKIPYTYNKKASGVKVKQWNCEHYEGTFEGNKVEDVWSADWKNLGLTRVDFQVLEDLGDFFDLGSFTEEYDKFYRLETKEGKYLGIPIKRIHYSDGQIDSITEQIEIKKKDLPSTLFDLPEGLEKKKR